MVSFTLLMPVSSPQTSNYTLALLGSMKSLNIKKYNLNMLQVILLLFQQSN